MPLILRVIAWLIVCYRRWLSGRGPLRDVRCSFAPEESCSAYGLRVTRDATSARQALGRIVRRLRRCRDACLLTDGAALSWAPVHDDSPAAIAAALRRDGEQPAALARMLAVRRAVALWRADRAAASACRGAEPARPRVVSQPAVARRARRRLATLVALSVVGLVVVWLQPWLGGVALTATLGGSALCGLTLIERERRFALHQRWARWREPAAITASADEAASARITSPGTSPAWARTRRGGQAGAGAPGASAPPAELAPCCC